MTASYGWYGDDFTGATDTLATIAERGHRAFLFLGVPSPERLRAMPDLDAIGIAGAARSMAPAAMHRELAPVGAFFQRSGVRILHYKCCSTFDSGPEIGNLATAIAVLRGHAADPRVAIVGGQPSLGRFCAFSNLFAAAEGEVHRLDRHPTMAVHPATPMGESDLRLHLTRSGIEAISAIHWPDLDRGRAEARWDHAPAGAVLFDVLTQDHLERIGRCLNRAQGLLVVGPSSVAEAVFGTVPIPAVPVLPPGPVLGFAGSLSAKTRRQIAAARLYTHIEASPEAVVDRAERAEVISRAAAALRAGENVLINTAARPAPRALPDLAEGSARLVDDILREAPVRRLIVAGGDTSSHIVAGLGVWGLSFHARFADGVTVCAIKSDDAARDGMLVLLKGGQMGDDDLFDRFATGRALAMV